MKPSEYNVTDPSVLQNRRAIRDAAADLEGFRRRSWTTLRTEVLRLRALANLAAHKHGLPVENYPPIPTWDELTDEQRSNPPVLIS